MKKQWTDTCMWGGQKWPIESWDGNRAAITGHITGITERVILVEGAYLSWVDALVSFLDGKSCDHNINTNFTRRCDASLSQANVKDILFV